MHLRSRRCKIGDKEGGPFLGTVDKAIRNRIMGKEGKRSVNGLALFSGMGGLETGIRIALGDGYRTICHVEWEAYAAATLVARMEDKALDPAPVWDDVHTFDCGPWAGKVDLVSAGFPCPPVSLAGKGKGLDDERWLWPQVVRVVRETRPGWVFLENVRGLLSANDGRELGEIFRDLDALGFDAEWVVLPASSVGASHERDRIFILANSRDRQFPLPGWATERRNGVGSAGETMADRAGRGRGELREPYGSEHARRRQPDGGCEKVANAVREPAGSEQELQHGERSDQPWPGGSGMADAKCERRQEGRGHKHAELRSGSRDVDVADAEDSYGGSGGRGVEGDAGLGGRGLDGGRKELADAELQGSQGGGYPGKERRNESVALCGDRGTPSCFAPGPSDGRWDEILSVSPHVAPAVEPGFCVLVDGVPMVVDAFRTDQLRCTGNAVVPLQAAVAFVELYRRASAGMSAPSTHKKTRRVKRKKSKR